MKPILLIDFGSTYTKVTAVDVEAEVILGTAQSFTTIQTDINDGLDRALKLLEVKTGHLDYEKCYACSSAAGGLRMITSGLVPELTGEAAKLSVSGRHDPCIVPRAVPVIEAAAALAMSEVPGVPA